MYNRVFDTIAQVYGWFYGWQKRGFTDLVGTLEREGFLTAGERILDVGCGTGALCAVLNEAGYSSVGVDASERMISVARSKAGGDDLPFFVADGTGTLPFPSKSFDTVIASHVVHGMVREERIMFYEEMKRLASHTVVIHDYNRRRTLVTDILEYLEKGDYFSFIRVVEDELREQFPALSIIEGKKSSHLYICSCS